MPDPRGRSACRKDGRWWIAPDHPARDFTHHFEEPRTKSEHVLAHAEHVGAIPNDLSACIDRRGSELASNARAHQDLSRAPNDVDACIVHERREIVVASFFVELEMRAHAGAFDDLDRRVRLRFAGRPNELGSDVARARRCFRVCLEQQLDLTDHHAIADAHHACTTKRIGTGHDERAPDRFDANVSVVHVRDGMERSDARMIDDDLARRIPTNPYALSSERVTTFALDEDQHARKNGIVRERAPYG